METLYNSAIAGLSAGVVIPIIWWLLNFMVGSYGNEKLKNLATKQDIADITTKIEEAKQPFFELQEQIKATHQLRFAAIDKRLEIHQESFIKWIKLLNSIHTPNVQTVEEECAEWYRNHCLYLEPVVREAFSDACLSAKLHHTYLRPLDKNGANENWEVIMKFPKILFEAIKLTPISETELNNIRNIGNSSQANDQQPDQLQQL